MDNEIIEEKVIDLLNMSDLKEVDKKALIRIAFIRGCDFGEKQTREKVIEFLK